MTPEEFRVLLEERSDAELLGHCLVEDVTPFVFEPAPDRWNRFRDELVRGLGISPVDIRVVGSARFGFSTKPYSGLRAFNDNSDIDVAIVNSDLFDRLWLELLAAAYPRPPVTETLGGWLRSRRNEVYTGWVKPLGIHIDAGVFGAKARPVLDFKKRWFETLQSASRLPPRRHESVSGRLYRTWKHAELYHLNSLASLRKSLIS